MLYSGFNILPRSVFWLANLNGRSDNTDVIQLLGFMNATFEAIDTLIIEGRGFVIYGNILAGEIQSGQTVAIRFNSSISMTLEIDSIEYIDIGRDKKSYVALSFAKLDDETIDLLKSLKIGNETLEITD